jgi:Carboxypeptidase regulatory-like domain
MAKNISFQGRGLLGAVATAILLITLVPHLSAQTAATGALSGTVTDSTGAVVPNVTVTATSADTGQARTTTTAADGTYKFSVLAPGSYRVKFEAAGFGTAEVPSATVNVTETEVLNRTLQVGSQTQEVSVQADVETVQTASSALGTVVNTATVTELPLNTRNYTNLLAMSAGANAPVTNATALGKASSLVAVNGGGTAQNNYLQDGVSLQNWYSFGTGTEGTEYGSLAIPNPDTIAEFKIQTSTYDAGYGRNPGANVNVITKSGTNGFHGAAFEFFRNTVLNANDWFFKSSEGAHLSNTGASAPLPNKQPVLNQNQFGGVFGGPVKEDKLFFFVSYQETQQKNGISGYGASSVELPPIPTIPRGTCTTGFTDPTVGCDATAQAFIKALATNMSPAAGCPNAGVKAFQVVTAGSINVACPANPVGVTGPPTLYNINPVAIKLLQLPLVGSSGQYLIPSSNSANYASQSFSLPAIFHDHQGLGNFDYVINSKNTLSGRYDYETDPLNATMPVINATVAGTDLPGNPATTTKTDHSAILKLTTIVTPNFVNEARISYQRYVTLDTEQSTYTNSSVGITDLDAKGSTPIADDLSYFCITGTFCFGAHYFYGVYLPENQYEFADQISWTHGKHAFRAGFESERVQANQVYPSVAIGSPAIQSFNDLLIGRCGTGSAGCTLPNGAAGSNIQTVAGSFAKAEFPYLFRDTSLDGFVQDDFKVNSRLTLNLGLRWEYDGYLSEKYGNYANLWTSLVNTAPNPGSGCVINGQPLGAGASGTGCSLTGFAMPSNYTGPLPAGLYKNTNQGPEPSTAPKDDFAPRVGFAWEPTANDRWVLRGGAGYFYDLTPGEDSGNPITETAPGVGVPVPQAPAATLANPWVIPTGITPGPPNSFGFPSRWVSVPTGAGGATVTGSNLGVNGVEQNVTVPLVYEWNLNTQYEFAPTWVLEVGYVGSHGIHQSPTSAAGQGQGTTSPFNLAQLVGVGSPCVNCLPGVTTNTVGNVQGRVPNLGVSAASAVFATNSGYKYNSLQATVRKQFSHGLQLQAAYTWSRALLGYADGVNTYPYLIFRYGLNTAYRPQRLVLNYVWNLPLGHPQGLEGRLAEGWTLSGVTTIQGGAPITITDPTLGSIFGDAISTANFCPGMTNANVVASGSLTQRVLSGLAGGSGYFNPGKSANCVGSVFGPGPTVGVVNGAGGGIGYGNAGYGIVLGPGQSNWDMAIAKTTKVGGVREGATLEFRSEFFNAFNHPQFSNPTAVVTSATFGKIGSMSVNPRLIQFALKYSF